VGAADPLVNGVARVAGVGPSGLLLVRPWYLRARIAVLRAARRFFAWLAEETAA
jgi:hypothetical protein